jgi:hypothetical protein
MAELRHSLRALVERPPAAPVAIAVVAARAAGFERRRRALYGSVGLALVAITSAAGLGVALQGSESGVNLASAGPNSAGYIAERPGGYVATGTWQLTITRGGQVTKLDSTSHPHCGRTGLILPGDEVRGSITGPNSALRVGERFTCLDAP